MVSDIFFDNKKYISVKDASTLTGYSKDYIGQLCRHKKVLSRRIGRTWYVEEESIVTYKDTPTTFDFSKNFYSKANSSPKEECEVYPITDSTLVSAKTLVSVKSHFYPKFSQSVQKLLSSVDLSKNISPRLVSLVASVLIIVGLVVGIERGSSLSDISKHISEAPQEIYSGASEIVNFYSDALTSKYIKLGNGIISSSKSFGNSATLAINNPTLFVKQTLESISHKEKDIDSSGSNKIDEGFLALVFSPKHNFVENVSLITYSGVNSWFYDSVYTPFTKLFNFKPEIINTVYLVKGSQGTTTKETATNAPVVATNVVNNNKVIERIIEKVAPSGITSEYIDQRLQELDNKIQSQFSSLSTGTGGNITNVYQQIAQSQRIDQLSGTSINNPTITGGSISNTSIDASSFTTNTLTATSATLGTTTITNLAVTNTSTSTFAGGVEITSGCFSINGTCMGTGTGTFTNTIANGGTGNTSFSPNSIVTVNAAGTALIATTSQLTVGSLISTTTADSYFIGNLGIGTFSPTGLLDVNAKLVVSNTGFGTTTVSGLNISGSATSTSNVGFNITGGCFAINGTCLGNSSPLTFTYPLVNTANNITLGFGTTTSNTWAGVQTFTYSSSTIYSSFATASTTNLIVSGSSFNNLLGTGLSNVGG
ncbi:MAG: helix-turn-helix domain-containing protein, partial [Minisyncoccia bacterium]